MSLVLRKHRYLAGSQGTSRIRVGLDDPELFQIMWTANEELAAGERKTTKSNGHLLPSFSTSARSFFDLRYTGLRVTTSTRAIRRTKDVKINAYGIVCDDEHPVRRAAYCKCLLFFFFFKVKLKRECERNLSLEFVGVSLRSGFRARAYFRARGYVSVCAVERVRVVAFVENVTGSAPTSSPEYVHQGVLRSL